MYSLYSHLTDWRALVLMVAFVVGTVWLSPKRLRHIVALCLLGTLLTTVLFMTKRAGVCTLFDSYASGGPDQYFYTQNVIAYLAAACAIAGLVTRLNARIPKGLALTLPFLLLLQVPYSGTFGANNYMAETRGTIRGNAYEACKRASDSRITVRSYPQEPFTFTADRLALCTSSVTTYSAPAGYLGLVPDPNRVIFAPGTTDSFTQTFASPRDGLRGVNILIGTYGKPIRDKYRFSLYDASCRSPLLQIILNDTRVSDNGYYPVSFPALPASAGRTYCFSLSSESLKPERPVALRMTAPGIYTAGQAIVNEKPSESDVVFELIY
jgi:hypothetical protein